MGFEQGREVPPARSSLDAQALLGREQDRRQRVQLLRDPRKLPSRHHRRAAVGVTAEPSGAENQRLVDPHSNLLSRRLPRPADGSVARHIRRERQPHVPWSTLAKVSLTASMSGSSACTAK